MYAVLTMAEGLYPSSLKGAISKCQKPSRFGGNTGRFRASPRNTAAGQPVPVPQLAGPAMPLAVTFTTTGDPVMAVVTVIVPLAGDGVPLVGNVPELVQFALALALV